MPLLVALLLFTSVTLEEHRIRNPPGEFDYRAPVLEPHADRQKKHHIDAWGRKKVLDDLKRFFLQVDHVKAQIVRAASLRDSVGHVDHPAVVVDSHAPLETIK